MSRAAAFFDVDGTLVRGNIVRWYVHLRTLPMGRLARALWTAAFALRVPWYVVLDACSRPRFQAALYRSYRRFGPEELVARARTHFSSHMEARLYPRALARLRAHQDQGHDVVLVTGSLAPIVAPVAVRVAATAVLAPDLEQRDGRYTGALVPGTLAGERKAEAAAAWADERGVDLSQCYAYADSLDDLPLLRRVGHPVVVNAGGRLRRIARREGWEILDWRRR